MAVTGIFQSIDLDWIELEMSQIHILYDWPNFEIIICIFINLMMKSKRNIT